MSLRAFPSYAKFHKLKLEYLQKDNFHRIMPPPAFESNNFCNNNFLIILISPLIFYSFQLNETVLNLLSQNIHETSEQNVTVLLYLAYVAGKKTSKVTAFRHAFLYPFVCMYNISHFRLIPLRLCLSLRLRRLYVFLALQISFKFSLNLMLKVLTMYFATFF